MKHGNMLDEYINDSIGITDLTFIGNDNTADEESDLICEFCNVALIEICNPRFLLEIWLFILTGNSFSLLVILTLISACLLYGFPTIYIGLRQREIYDGIEVVNNFLLLLCRCEKKSIPIYLNNLKVQSLVRIT
jgi:hypothetical protein